MSIFSHEFGARVILKLLMDKGIVTQAEWISACQEVNKWFVNLHTKIYDEEFEPTVVDFTPDIDTE